jgi:hypothetical protein
MQMFVELTKDFDENLDFQFDIQELVTLIEYFNDPKMLGPNRIQEIVMQYGVKFVQEFNTYRFKNMEVRISKRVYKKLYDLLCDPKFDYVSLDKIMPFLFLFTLTKQFIEIEKKYKNYSRFLGNVEATKDSILGLYQKHGLKDIYEKEITYNMTEKVIVDFRRKNLNYLKFEQVEATLSKVKER